MENKERFCVLLPIVPRFSRILRSVTTRKIFFYQYVLHYMYIILEGPRGMDTQAVMNNS